MVFWNKSLFLKSWKYKPAQVHPRREKPCQKHSSHFVDKENSRVKNHKGNWKLNNLILVMIVAVVGIILLSMTSIIQNVDAINSNATFANPQSIISSELMD